MKIQKLCKLFGTLFAALFITTACTEDETVDYPTFNGMYVTIQGDEFSGYKFYTDNDAVLIPTNISKYEHLKGVDRAQISFNMVNGITDVTQIKSGNKYEIILMPSGVNMEIPTYHLNVDVTSDDYLVNGNDSINTNNRMIHSFAKQQGAFYVQNGYLNIIPTFAYSPTAPVYFGLYYDGTKDIDLANRKLTLHLYFNNHTTQPYGTTTSVISFRMSEDVYNKFLYEGYDNNSQITVSLEGQSLDLNENRLEYVTTLGDFLLPSEL